MDEIEEIQEILESVEDRRAELAVDIEESKRLMAGEILSVEMTEMEP